MLQNSYENIVMLRNSKNSKRPNMWSKYVGVPNMWSGLRCFSCSFPMFSAQLSDRNLRIVKYYEIEYISMEKTWRNSVLEADQTKYGRFTSTNVTSHI